MTVQRPAAVASEIPVWLAELGLAPVDAAERDGAHSWDLVLDGRRRRALRLTLILDPSVALVCWVQLAPPLVDSQRKVYRQLLRWNDELPFAKFALSEDERAILTAEVPVEGLDRDVLGALVARALAISDLVNPLLSELIGELARRQAKLAETEPDPAGAALLKRYAGAVAELAATEP